MKKSEIESGLRQCFSENTVPDAVRGGREKLILTARQTYRTAVREKRISFWQFVLYQIKFTGRSIWGTQIAVLAAIYLTLYITVNGDFAYLWNRRLPVLLCFSSVFLLLPALPAIVRSLRYGMAEVEQASRFSSIHLLTARLVIISAGDILMLAVLTAGIVLGMGQSLGAVVLYLLVPFFLLGSIYITIALHVDVQHVLKICLAVGTTEELVTLVNGKVWNGTIPAGQLAEYENRLQIVNLRNEADGRISVRYLAEKPGIEDSVPAVPRLEDLYLWMFPESRFDKEAD